MILNASDLDTSFYFTASAPDIVTSALARVLKAFREHNDDLYHPKYVTWSVVAKCFGELSTLQNFDLTSLRTDEERLSFFINVYNLLFIHAMLHARRYDRRHGLASWEMNEVTAKLHFWRYRYLIGSIGVVSLQGLYDGLSPLRTTFYEGKVEHPRRKENGFLLANSTNKTTVRVLYPAFFQAQTNLAIEEYLDRSLIYQSKRKVVRLPTWLFQVS